MKTKLLTLSLALAAGLVPTAHASVESDLFDKAIAGGLPTEVSLPADDGGTRLIRVTERLDAGVDGDASADGAIYLIEVAGVQGTLLRLGGELDIALDETPPTPAPGARSRRSAIQDWGFAGYGDLLIPEDHSVHDPAEIYSHGPDQEDGVHVWIFLHDKSGETSDAKVLNWYMSWWIRDMKNNVSPETSIRVSVRRRIPGLTDMDYHQGTDVDRIWDVGKSGADYVKTHEAGGSGVNKYLLLISDLPRNWPSDRRGGAIAPYNAAIASNTGIRHVVAHEVGHLLGAADEDGNKSPWYCTYTMGPMEWPKAACQLYSEQSADEIRRYLNRLR